MRAVCENRASIHLLEWGSGGTRLSHGRSKTERVELGAVSAVRPLSCHFRAFLHFYAQKSPVLGDFSASFVQFRGSFVGSARIVCVQSSYCHRTLHRVFS